MHVPVLSRCVFSLAVLFFASYTQAAQVLKGAAAQGDWRADAPGVRRHIVPSDVPPPTTGSDPEKSIASSAKVVQPLQGAMPKVPDGFAVQVFATGLKQPRTLRVAPNGDIFLSESGTGRVLVFRAGARGTPKPEVFAENLDRPYGIAFLPPANPQYVYDLGVGGMPEMTPEKIRQHEKTHGRGAAWGDEENRGVVRVFDPDGKKIRNYATGLRNCSGLAMQPGTDNLWCVVNERDHLGPLLVPDFMARAKNGDFFGWPWYYLGVNEDPALKGKRPDLKAHVRVPEVLFQAHSSALSAAFYDHTAFPAEYRGDAFVALHGSHSRPDRTGYKVVRVLMKNGNPTGEYEDFMTGFVVDNDSVWGRPAGVAVTRDGALLVSDDANGTIFRISRK